VFDDDTLDDDTGDDDTVESDEGRVYFFDSGTSDPYFDEPKFWWGYTVPGDVTDCMNPAGPVVQEVLLPESDFTGGSGDYYITVDIEATDRFAHLSNRLGPIELLVHYNFGSTTSTSSTTTTTSVTTTSTTTTTEPPEVAPVLSNGFWNPPDVVWTPFCETNPCATLSWYACDENNDLIDGDVSFFHTGTDITFFGYDIPWSDLSVPPDVTDCDNPSGPFFHETAIPEATFDHGPDIYVFAVDIQATDDLGNHSDKLENIEITIYYYTSTSTSTSTTTTTTAPTTSTSITTTTSSTTTSPATTTTTAPTTTTTTTAPTTTTTTTTVVTTTSTTTTTAGGDDDTADDDTGDDDTGDDDTADDDTGDDDTGDDDTADDDTGDDDSVDDDTVDDDTGDDDTQGLPDPPSDDDEDARLTASEEDEGCCCG